MDDYRDARLAEISLLTTHGRVDNSFQHPKPIEELYDTEKDPWELNNLAVLQNTQSGCKPCGRRQRIFRMNLKNKVRPRGGTREMKPGGKCGYETPSMDMLEAICLPYGRFISVCKSNGGIGGPWNLFSRQTAQWRNQSV